MKGTHMTMPSPTTSRTADAMYLGRAASVLGVRADAEPPLHCDLPHHPRTRVLVPPTRHTCDVPVGRLWGGATPSAWFDCQPSDARFHLRRAQPRLLPAKASRNAIDGDGQLGLVREPKSIFCCCRLVAAQQLARAPLRIAPPTKKRPGALRRALPRMHVAGAACAWGFTHLDWMQQ